MMQFKAVVSRDMFVLLTLQVPNTLKLQGRANISFNNNTIFTQHFIFMEKLKRPSLQSK